MTISNYKKVFKQLKVKPAKLKKYIKHNAPKQRVTGKLLRRCRLCGSMKGHISKYGIGLCRRCFRDHAKEIGFKKYK